ncbi:hypothetical protein V6N13_065906 [Hibiscus sabdariffa]
MEVAATLAWKTANAPRADKYKFKKHLDDILDVSCLMLATMTPELQKQRGDMDSLKDELATDDILQSLLDIFKPFVLNFIVNEINKTLPQLLGMLRTAESDLKKNGSKSILMVREVEGKRKAKSKGNGKSKPKGNDALKPEKGISKDGKCFHRDKTGH